VIQSDADDSLKIGGVNPIIHHIMGNIKGDAFAKGDFSAADQVMKYFPPAP